LSQIHDDKTVSAYPPEPTGSCGVKLDIQGRQFVQSWSEGSFESFEIQMKPSTITATVQSIHGVEIYPFSEVFPLKLSGSVNLDSPYDTDGSGILVYY
jgi:hypothetical protein